MSRPACWLVIAAFCGSAEFAAAQGVAGTPPRFSLAVGTTFFGGHQAGDVTAELRRNSPGPPATLTFLRAESRIDRAAGLDGRLSVRLTRAVAVEVGGSYTRPQLAVSISQDAEAGTTASATERLSQYAVDVSGVVELSRAGGRRLRPYVLGGGGYLRQLDEARLRVDPGRTMHAGAGAQYFLRGGTARRPRPFGVRAEARIVYRTGGFDLAGRARVLPAVSALAFFGL